MKGESKWLGEPNGCPLSRLYSLRWADSPQWPRIYRIKCGGYLNHRQLGSTPAENPTREHGNNRGAVTDVGGGTVAPSHPPATAHASSPARDGRMKRRARTARTGPHSPRSAEDLRMTRDPRAVYKL